jgi:membrane associated rhomboid family serine protease
MLTATFLHGGWFHVVGNLLYLRVFGDNVEDRLGHLGFLLFYFGSAAAGATAQAIVAPTSTVPMIGASGAIAGVLGAYIVLFPRARILTLFPIVIVLTFIEVPAVLFLGIWALQQFLNGFLVVTAPSAADGGIAWFAHIGGFGLGIGVGLLRRLIGRVERRRRE